MIRTSGKKFTTIFKIRNKFFKLNKKLCINNRHMDVKYDCVM